MNTLNYTVFDEISKIKKINHSMINNEMSIREEIGLTSLEMISILTSICSISDINLMNLSDFDIINMNTVGDIIKILKDK